MNKFEQLMVLTMEECGELTQACSKQMRGSPSAQKLLLEEVGDVQCMINLIIKNNEIVKNISFGDKVDVVFNKTIFYAESGGQISDRGSLEGVEFKANVLKTKKNNMIIKMIGSIEDIENLRNPKNKFSGFCKNFISKSHSYKEARRIIDSFIGNYWQVQ